MEESNNKDTCPVSGGVRSLREVLHDAKEKGIAVGHFNVSDSTQCNAIVSAAKEVGVPVIIGVSEGEEDFIGMHNAVALVRSARERGSEVYLNADHHKSVESCKDVIDAGYDSVIFDGVELDLEENIARTKEVVEYARNCSRDVLVEAELGYIGTSSKVLDEVPHGVDLDMLPTVQDAEDFVSKTGVDALAPAVGNLHGMLKHGNNPSLKISLIEDIRRALPDTHLVLHGGSGLTDSDFVNAITAGMNCVHINTEIRKAYREGIEASLEADKDQVAPYKYLNSARDMVSEVVKDRLRLFNKM